MSSNWLRSAWLSLLLVAACSAGGPAASTSPPATSGTSPAISTPSSAISPSPAPGPTPTPLVAQREELSMPDARQEVASATARGAIWVLGGFDPQRRSSDSVFTLAGGSWITGPVLPQRIDHAAAAELAGAVYYAGGFTDGQAQAATYEFAAPRGWTTRARLHHARGAHALLAIAGKLYAVGGNGPAGNEPAVEEYDPTSDTWSDVATLPAPRNHVAGFVYRGLACIAGGRAPNVARVDCLDPSNRSWSRLPDLPTPTSGAGAGTLGDQVIVAGGENSGESTLIPSVFRFTGQTWTTEAMLIPRHGVQLAAAAGRLWACGGATSAGYAASPRCTSVA